MTNTATRTWVADRQYDDGESLDLLPGPVPGTDGASYALVAFGPNGIFAQDTTGQFAAFDGGGYPGGAACLLYGTLKVA